ncbi:uncharacterized protein LOC117788204 isoform X2 [Drosophila innubila]|uniref:uncharacterized protein LOC117788204 isoform X2 n=1 Tax=Drosophila innubila TaxID=198719 RepID=UPI00148E19C2|nr:uncharacterized protein LOC117788204 isoform X2 [Drosophila innubila]
MSHGERKGRLNVVKFLELAFSIACLVLHFYSFNDRDIMTSFMATGTFTGYIIVVIGVFAVFWAVPYLWPVASLL